jgi:crotonobetainyl-CoA:carnitine CoA-transferase CaiB-like acyl-CoA transferase
MSKSVLDGYTVIDMSEVYQAPLAAQVLGDFGAQVIKVERPGVGDVMRNMDAYAREHNLVSCYFASANRNKMSICIDVKTARGREILMKLVQKADVLIHNYRPGVMERLSLGYDDLAKVNGRLVYAVATGFGEDGPIADRPAQDMIAQTISGIAMAGVEDGEPPRIMGSAAIDFSSGMILVQGILLALLERERSGKGQKVHACLFDTAMAVQSAEAASILMYDYETNWHRRGLSFVVQTKDGWVTILGFFRPNPLRLFCAALGLDDLSQKPEYDTIEKQIAHKDALQTLIGREAAKYTSAECIARFEKQDVICAPALKLKDTLQHPQVAHNRMVAEMDIRGQGTVRLVGSPLKLSRTGPEIRRGPPVLGADAAEVLGILGYSRADMQALAAEGALGADAKERAGEFA